MTTGVMPSMTLGSGGVGGAITGDNITVHHMYNVKRLAYETTPPPEAALRPGSTDDPSQLRRNGSAPVGAEADRVDEIVQRVLAELKK
jgi:acetaldehyde dehydrogenase (acetylating)